MSEPTAADLFRAGDLTGAIAAAQAAVRKAPSDLDMRILLAEFLVFSGNLERADVLGDAASTIELHDRHRRRRVPPADPRRHGAPPTVPGRTGARTAVRPDRAAQRLQLAALVALRAGDMAEAAKCAAAAEEARPQVAGFHNDKPFDDLRDADDLLAGTMEVLTTTGKYFWIPTERILSAEFHPPKRPRDLIWRRVSMSVSEGPDGEVYVPAIYAGGDPATDLLRLGRETDWTDPDAGPVRGIGQRVFLLGDDDVAIMDLGTLRFGA